MSEYGKHTIEISGWHKTRLLLVDGWHVPFVEAKEMDGGKVMFVVDGRFGFEVAAGEFEEVARLVAYTYAIAIGLGCFPEGDLSPEERQRLFAHATVPPTCWPHRHMQITDVAVEEVEPDPDNDPRSPS